MIVVDTNIVSELMKSSPSPEVAAWFAQHDPLDLRLTSITVAEILFGLERLPEGQRKNLLRNSAEQVFTTLNDLVLSFDINAASHYAEIVHYRNQQGLPIKGFDAQIAAICRANGAALVTRNERDFVLTGIEVLNPWSS